jgi:hypothetical protein
VREKLVRGIVTVFDNAPDAVLRAQLIGHLIGFDFSSSPDLQVILHDARQFRDDAFYYTTQFFKEATRGKTGVIMLEDLHWADDGSLNLLEYLLQPAGITLLIIVLPPVFFEHRPEWGRMRHHLRLDLLPLLVRTAAALSRDLRKFPKFYNLMDISLPGEGNYSLKLIKVLMTASSCVAMSLALNTKRLVNLKIPTTLVGVLNSSG